MSLLVRMHNTYKHTRTRTRTHTNSHTLKHTHVHIHTRAYTHLATCRMLMHKTTEEGEKQEPDYHVVTSVVRYMLDQDQLKAVREVGCCFFYT